MSGSRELERKSGADETSDARRSDDPVSKALSNPTRHAIAAMVDKLHPGFADELTASDAALLHRRALTADKREAAAQDSAVRRAKQRRTSKRRHYGSGVGAAMRESVAGARQASAAERQRRRAAHRPTKRRTSRFVVARGRQKVFLDALRTEIAEMRGVTIGSVPDIPPIDWRIRSENRSIARDATGRVAIRYAMQLPSRLRHLLMKAVGREGGWKKRASRRLVACAWATWRLARTVKGGARVVDGFCRKVWCMLVVDADGHVPSISTLWGTQVGRRGVPAPMTVLRRLGMWVRVQPPSGDARYVGFSGWAVGQCWFAAAVFEDARDEAEERLFAEEFQALLAALDPG